MGYQSLKYIAFSFNKDLVHRRYAFELMLDVARTEGRGCQFVFLTPLDVRYVHVSVFDVLPC